MTRSRPHRPLRRHHQRGVALVLVLGVLTVLTVMLTEFQDEASAEFGNATAERDALKAEYAAKSAVNLGRLLIAAEPTMRKSLALIMSFLPGGSAFQLPVWLYADQILGAFNDQQAQEAFASLSAVDLTEGKNLGLPGAAFDLVIVDEDAKINVNLPARPGVTYQTRVAQQLLGLIGPPQYDPMFEHRDADGSFSDRQAICSALVDWVDPDSELFPCDLGNYTAQTAAPEDTYYELLKRPYHRKNAALDSFQELYLVRGISDEFWSTFVEPEPNDPRKRVLTVWGQGKLNFNTMNPQTRMAVVCAAATPETNPCNDPQQAESLLGMLTMVDLILPGVPIFGNIDGFIKIVTGRSKGQFAELLNTLMPDFKKIVFQSEADFKNSVGMESKVFSFYATGRVKSGKRETKVRVHAVVDFRDAPPPGVTRNAEALALETAASSGMLRSGTGSSATKTDTSDLPEGATEEAIASVLKPSPGGSVIYYRID
jgi:general secretion pathway protein K